MWLLFNSDEEEVAFLRDVKLLQKVGQGASGAVYLGLWQGAQTVAVKLIVNTLDKELDLRTVKVQPRQVLHRQPTQKCKRHPVESVACGLATRFSAS
jgi:hypothetical protein